MHTAMIFHHGGIQSTKSSQKSLETTSSAAMLKFELRVRLLPMIASICLSVSVWLHRHGVSELLTILEQPLSLHPQSDITPKDKDSDGGNETDQNTDQVPHLQRLWVDEVGDLARWRRQRDILICRRRHGRAKKE